MRKARTRLPAGVGQAVITEDWSVAIAEVVAQDAVVALYPDSDYCTTALASAAPEVVENWIGLRVETSTTAPEERRAIFR